MVNGQETGPVAPRVRRRRAVGLAKTPGQAPRQVAMAMALKVRRGVFQEAGRNVHRMLASNSRGHRVWQRDKVRARGHQPRGQQPTGWSNAEGQEAQSSVCPPSLLH